MALRQIRLRKEINDLRTQMNGASEKRSLLEERRKALELREAELETAIGEVTEETAEADKKALDEEVAKWEQEDEALTKEEGENLETTRKLQEQIDALQKELNELDERSRRAAQPPVQEERKVETTMNTRKLFFGMNHQERDAFMAREDIKGFLRGVRDLASQNRTVSGAELGIPTIVFDLVREVAYGQSKLIKHVKLRKIGGHGRQLTMGAVPPAVWTEQCGKINEIGLQFNMVEVDGFKIAGYIRICNSILEDVSAAGDIALMEEIINALGESIGGGYDMAIIYGTGVKMPLGVVTRLAQSAKPENYPTKAREWKNLTGNLVTVSGNGVEFFADLADKTGKMKRGKGEKFWAMNSTTHMKIMSKALAFSASGALVSTERNEMPYVGGKIEELEFMPDGIVVGGYGQRYLFVERAETKISKSEHVLFLDDETVFMGKARADGVPVIAEAFIGFGIDGVAPSPGDVTFPEDLANA